MDAVVEKQETNKLLFEDILKITLESLNNYEKNH